MKRLQIFFLFFIRGIPHNVMVKDKTLAQFNALGPKMPLASLSNLGVHDDSFVHCSDTKLTCNLFV